MDIPDDVEVLVGGASAQQMEDFTDLVYMNYCILKNQRKKECQNQQISIFKCNKR
jgi:hypothetical protein